MFHIIGAGIAGLSLAVQLRHAGVKARSIRVYERSSRSDLVSRSDTFLSIPRKTMLKALSPCDSLNPTDTVPFGPPIFNRMEIRTVGHEPQIVHADGRYFLRRNELVEPLLFDVARHGVEVRFNTSVDLGSLSKSDWIIGADGTRSSVRKWLFPQDGEAIPTGEVSRFIALKDVFPGYYGPGSLTFHRSMNAMVGVFTPPVAEGAEQVVFARFRESAVNPFEGLDIPRWIYSHLNASNQCIAALSAPQLMRWREGRVVLIGDAAHGRSPAHGMGALDAIHDAEVLAPALALGDERGVDEAIFRRQTAMEAEVMQVRNRALANR